MRFARRLSRPLMDPHRRYQNAKFIHATRVALGILITIAFSSIAQLPHAEWSTISLIIVIGGLQHHGNIRKRAAERALGTIIGAIYGLLIILQQSYFGLFALTYLLMAVGCGVCAYHAIGKGGYVALLSAVTLVIVAGHGDNQFDEGLWRAINVFIGIVVALLLSFALPLYATYSWRFKLADALRGCARVYERITLQEAISNEDHLKEMARLGSDLVQLRSLIPSVSKEVHMPVAKLESVQRSLRIVISCLEILSTPTVDRPVDTSAGIAAAPPAGLRPASGGRISDALYGMARALKSGSARRLAPYARGGPQDYAGLSAGGTVANMLASEVEQIRATLAGSASRWAV
nr:FUSC family protein [Bordetella sp. LUAb4]